MEFGIAMFVTDETVAPNELGPLVEQRGFDSLWVPEHTHIPVSRRTPYPSGGELPRQYLRTLDPFVGLTAAAAATSTLLVGTGILLVIERDPIVTAKEVATLDLLSGGRFLFGVGAGWNVEEMENHGSDASTRFRLMRERVEAMKAIWTEDEAAYHGRLVDFDPIWSWPKPLQRPHPPVVLGGNGPRVIERVLAYGDGWAPNAERSPIVERIEELRQRASELGRELPVSPFTRSRDQAMLEALVEAGVARIVFWVGPGPRDEIEPELDELVGLVDRVRATTGAAR
jgi:probable F420-dependent oxidoreductase